MRTNKRTVWFLTLLSLVAVISIYYIKEKSPMPFDGVNIFKDPENAVTMVEKMNDTDKTKPVFAEAVVFEEMRMTVRDERSKLGDQLLSKMLSPDITAEERNQAFEDKEKLIKLQSAEDLMELQIVAMGYPEVFVRNDAGDVKITVLSQEGHSAKMAEEITHFVKTSWKDAKGVEISFTGDAE